jgi:uridylate kinase
MAKPKYKRVILKISGESFCREGEFGIDETCLASIARMVKGLASLGVETAVVVGAGNFIRGRAFSADGLISRNTADHMGMLATVINACALGEALNKLGSDSRVLNALGSGPLAERFSAASAARHLLDGRILLFAGGTGNPFFTTDTCAALRASELAADLVIKATKVDGVYSDDPKKNPDAVLFESLSYGEVLEKDLRIMDHAAISLCREGKVPIIVLNIFKEGNIDNAVHGRRVGTFIGPGPSRP